MYQWDKIKVIGNYDTVVVGGGTAGAAAGIRAAKEGNRVLIVEKSLALGGAAVNALVNPMMESFVEHGEIFHEIERRLKEKGSLPEMALWNMYIPQQRQKHLC